VRDESQKIENQENPAVTGEGSTPFIVAEELTMLRLVLAKIDGPQTRTKILVDDTATMIELRDALAEAKPEDQGPLLEQMHRIEALSRQRGKGDSPPVDRRSPYFGHLRLEENQRRRDVLIGQRGYVEPGGGIQIVDWRNAPVSRLYYRYDEGDAYEERIGDREVEGEILARRTITVVDAKLQRVATPHEFYTYQAGTWRSQARDSIRLGVQNTAGFNPVASPPGTKAKLGFGMDGDRRPDRFLPAIAALIDPRQFELISRPTSGTIVVQGSAGSGKTTIGLHRIAYLSFVEPGRFRPDRMLVIVYQRALATYVSRVLPELEVSGVPVKTFAAWAEQIRRSTFPQLSVPTMDQTPSLVIRAKSHGAILKILDDRQQRLAEYCRSELSKAVETAQERQALLTVWDGSKGPVDARLSTVARWVRDARLSLVTQNRLESVGTRLRMKTRDVVGEWAALLTDRQALGQGFNKHAPGLFSEGQLDAIHRYCVSRERLRTGHAMGDGNEPYALDVEDDALLLRIHQLQRGPLMGNRGPLVYEHLMVDEVQDFAPVELAVLLHTTSTRRSITLAGDTNQSIAPDHGFETWTEMLSDLGLPHECIEPLRVSYRSTRQIMDVAMHVLGPLSGDIRPQSPRPGIKVETFAFGSAGETCEFLVFALRDLMRTDPHASVALIARHPEQARLYYEALANSEIPGIRLVQDQDFSFRPGIDVTDVRQTKGLEFDIVVLLEVSQDSYPESDHARRLLHVAMTRAAHQLWITYTGMPSALLPTNTPS
jgi:DNA helicase-2/ATP-dependent DNA helicase PcrA